MAEADLSLAAELLWLAVEPGTGGLQPRGGRSRLRAALTAADRVDRPRAHGDLALGWRAGRRARRELVAAGLIEPSLFLRNLRLTDRHHAGQRFRALWERLEANELSEQRDQQMVVLLASAGVLAARLSTYEREIARRRLKSVLASEDAMVWTAPLAGATPLSDGIAALGMVSLHGIDHLLHDALDDLSHTTFAGHHPGGHDGDGDGGASSGGASP